MHSDGYSWINDASGGHKDPEYSDPAAAERINPFVHVCRQPIVISVTRLTNHKSVDSGKFCEPTSNKVQHTDKEFYVNKLSFCSVYSQHINLMSNESSHDCMTDNRLAQTST
jgi:hypothetical protein